MKYLGIDYGTKKVGFAESDGEGKLAFPMMISENNKDLVRDTLEIVKAMSIDGVVIGLSLDQKGNPNPVAEKAKAFGDELETKNIKVYYEKEWFTTAEARRQPDANRDVDDAAAALILQRYLERINPKVFKEDDEISDSDEE
jgi:putative Holliday junction resolvase